MIATIHDMISPADVQAVADAATRDALAFVEANKVAVVDLPSLTRAASVRTAIGEKQNEIAAKLAKPKSWAFQLHRWFCGLEAAALAPYTALDTYERDQIRAFHDAETKRRQERERVIAEAQRKANEDRATTEAAALERSGEHVLAAAVLAEATTAPLPTVVLPDEVRQVQSFRRSYKWRLDSPSLVPREFLAIDEAKVSKFAAAMKGTATVPGITFYHVDEPIR